MGILDKVRDFFYDDEEEFEEVKRKPSKHLNERKEKIKIIEKEDNEEVFEKQDISERELFKAERTFNFPFDVDEEDTKPEVQEPIVEEKKEEVKTVYKETKPLSIRNYAKYEKEEKKEENKFKPTPVISPIYGILDKNYKKEDLLINDNNSSNKEEKKLDYETVRRRAYSNAYETQEEGDSKGIFFNLDDDNKKEDEEVKIIYNDVEPEEEKNIEDDKNKTIGEKIEEYEKSLENETESDDDILSETKEQDLFNLIDNMYNSDEDDDEEE